MLQEGASGLAVEEADAELDLEFDRWQGLSTAPIAWLIWLYEGV
jgi:hypothetical protein